VVWAKEWDAGLEEKERGLGDSEAVRLGCEEGATEEKKNVVGAAEILEEIEKRVRE
jgi:hypothetical protein